jgi:hypothetical protein
MADKRRHQKTQPKKGKPIKIPIPKRADFERVLRKAAKGSASRRPSK